MQCNVKELRAPCPQAVKPDGRTLYVAFSANIVRLHKTCLASKCWVCPEIISGQYYLFTACLKLYLTYSWWNEHQRINIYFCEEILKRWWWWWQCQASWISNNKQKQRQACMCVCAIWFHKALPSKSLQRNQKLALHLNLLARVQFNAILVLYK